ncbi:hypothetical protein [Rubricoccus marinus]|nr:hypothetical protein [Rubricoccus marinus]
MTGPLAPEARFFVCALWPPGEGQRTPQAPALREKRTWTPEAAT